MTHTKNEYKEMTKDEFIDEYLSKKSKEERRRLAKETVKHFWDF